LQTPAQVVRRPTQRDRPTTSREGKVRAGSRDGGDGADHGQRAVGRIPGPAQRGDVRQVGGRKVAGEAARGGEQLEALATHQRRADVRHGQGAIEGEQSVGHRQLVGVERVVRLYRASLSRYLMIVCVAHTALSHRPVQQPHPSFPPVH